MAPFGPNEAPPMISTELTWVQRARANWLKHEDRNTHFFHQYASFRKKINSVKGLVDDQGIRHEDGSTMRTMVHNYFTHLFQSEIQEINENVLNAVNVKVTSEMNQGLLAPFTHEEVKNALFSIGAALVWKSSLILWKWCKQ